SDTVELFADANYADRDSVYDVSNSFFSLHYWQDSETYSGTLGGRKTFWNGTQLELATAYTESDTRTQRVQSNVYNPGEKVNSNIWSVDARLDGPLFSIQTGQIMFATGAHFRKEDFRAELLLTD